MHRATGYNFYELLVEVLLQQYLDCGLKNTKTLIKG